MKSVLSLIGLFALTTLALSAADLSGKWSGTVVIARADGTSRTMPLLLILKHEGSTLTGSIGSTETDQRPFRNGKADADRLTFEIESQNGTVQRFDLKNSGDSIEGEVRAVTADKTETAGGRITLKRTSEK